MTTTKTLRAAAMGAATALALSATPALAQKAAPLWVGWDISIEGGVSFMNSGSDHVWAQDITLNFLPFSASSTDRKISPDLGVSGKVKANLRWGTWDAGVAYRGTFAFQQKETSAAGFAPPLGIRFPVGTQPITSLIPIPIPAVGLNAESKQDSTQHVVDFVVGYNKSYGWGEARLFGGLRFARLSTTTSTTFDSFGLLTFNAERDATFWGIGPTLGTEIKYVISRRWVVGASVQGAVLFGDRKTTNTKSVNLLGLSFSETDENGGARTAFSLDAELSLTYKTMSGFYFAVGYGVQALWGVNDTRYFDTAASFTSGAAISGGSSAGSVLNHGPFIRVGLLFGGYSPRYQGVK